MQTGKANTVLLYTTAAAVLVLSAYTLTRELGRPRVVYINIGKMTEAYKFKKDLEGEGTKNLYRIRNTIDSLKMADKTDPDPVIDSQILYAERAFDQYYTYSNQEMTKKVWERLNPQLEEFGKQNHYELVVGANGAGTILYGSPKSDVTEEAIQFINRKYEKGN
ncbi:MAG: hypothetical protein JNL13_06320 [Chitinophagaceae bacterium]|nr:hypothetical protein [Chitinophagaceae bacterium]